MTEQPLAKPADRLIAYGLSLKEDETRAQQGLPRMGHGGALAVAYETPSSVAGYLAAEAQFLEDLRAAVVALLQSKDPQP